MTWASDEIYVISAASVWVSGFRNVPVVERYETEGSDALTRHFTYILRGRNLLLTSERLFYNPDYPIAERFNTGYNNRGLPTAWKENGIAFQATWSGDNMTTLTQGNLTQRFTYIPLVGCTSVLLPSGNKLYYSYDTAGRLTAVKDFDSRLQKSYSYNLYSSDGVNAITESELTSGESNMMTTTRRLDCFGSLFQTSVSIPGGTLVTAVATDALGRPIRNYLPYQGDEINSSDEAQQAAISSLGDQQPWQDIIYEKWCSDDKHVVKLTTPTAEFSRKPTETSWLCNNNNIAELTCQQFACNGSWTPYNKGKYANGMLEVVRTVNPDGQRTLTFTDWKGLKILERRVVADGRFIDTYYIYDGWGRLVNAILPEGVKPLTENLAGTFEDPQRTEKIESQRALYIYDEAGRLKSRRIPGGGTSEYRYDRYGRLAFHRDGALAEKGKWIFHLYDTNGREVMTGTTSTEPPESAVDMTATYSTSENGLDKTGYQCADVALSGVSGLTATYYDDYRAVTREPFAALNQSGLSGLTSKGNVTAKLTKLITASKSSWLASVNRYDIMDRPTATYSTTVVDSIQVGATMGYDAASNPMTTTETVTSPTATYTVTSHTAYDILRRPTTVTRSFNGHEITESYIYDAQGRCTRNVVENYAIDRTFDLLGRLTAKRSPLYSERTAYSAGGDVTGHGQDFKSCVPKLETAYRYDGADRLISARRNNYVDLTPLAFHPGDSLVVDGSTSPLTSYSYDLNSQFTSLQRMSPTGGDGDDEWEMVDDLTYTYRKGRLVKLDDACEATNGLNLYDFEARFHDPSVGFLSPDPMYGQSEGRALKKSAWGTVFELKHRLH